MTKKRKPAKRSTSVRKPKSPVKRLARSALSIATSARRTVEERVAALAEVPLAVCENDETLQAMLNVLRDVDEPVRVRLAALQSLQAASFSVVAFESCRGDYIATLRAVAEDPDPELRQRVLGILAREKDGFAQKKLLEGLQNPEKALVPPEKALQLLSYDVHAEAYTVARAIVSKPPNAAAKREALRLLAADATAAPEFEKILLDKDEPVEIRQISAAALHALKPERLQAHAREILLDTSEQDEMQATSLTALTHFGDNAAIADDEALLKSVDRLMGEGSIRVKQSVRRFLSKFGR
ncbi:MAG: hypothetical protein ACREX3_04105 [Gammaproteobacteria bacterium]